MSVDNDWLTPRLPIAGKVVPYWGKPPLHCWLTAGAFSMFGFDEWVARVPSFLSFLVLCWCISSTAKIVCTQEVGSIAVLIFSSTSLIFFCSGASIVDSTLAACVGGALTAFAHFTVGNVSEHRFWPGILVFVLITLGFMTKGPVAIALVAIPIVGWSAVSGDRNGIRDLPWRWGAAFFFIVCLPWFYLSEQATPGFLRYFFLQENIGRFFIKNYGDRYGTGHRQPYGAIWLFYAVGCLPWTPLLVGELIANRDKKRLLASKGKHGLLYVCLWAATPLVMFTFARQLLITYAIPGVAGFSLVAATILCSANASSRLRRWLVGGIYCTPIVALLVVAAYLLLGHESRVSLVAILPLVLLFVPLVHLCQYPETSHTNVIASFAVCIVSLFSFILVLIEVPVNERYSAKPILQCLVNHATSSVLSVGVLGNRSSSSFFYSQADLGTTSKELSMVPVDEATPIKTVPGDLIFSRNDRSVNLKSIPADYSLVIELGSWSWMSKSGFRLASSDCSTAAKKAD